MKLQCRLAKDYLSAFCTEGGRTPFTDLLSITAGTAGLPNKSMTWLTVRAGKEIIALLNSWIERVTAIEGGVLGDTRIVYNTR